MVLVATTVCLATHGADDGPPESATPLAPRHHEFLDQVDLLIGDEELEVFLALGRDYQRDAFIERFWKVRDPFTQTSRNEFRERWLANLEAAKLRFPDLSEPRAQTLLQHGEPTRSFQVRCAVLPRLDIWYYSESRLFRGEFFLVFVRRGSQFQLWHPTDGLAPLILFRSALNDREAALLVRDECTRAGDILTAMSLSLDWRRFAENVELYPKPSAEWAQSFLSYTTDLPEDAVLLPADLRIDYPNRYQSRTVVQALIGVASGDATRGQIGERVSYNFLVDGEVLRRGELFEHFRYRFDFPVEGSTAEPESAGAEPESAGAGADPEVERIPIVLQRYLRPGEYTLVIKLQDLHSNRYFRDARDITVPSLSRQLPTEPVPVSVDAGPLEMLEEANQAALSRLSGDHTVRLRTPTGRLVTGRVRVEAEATGQGIARISFALNGRPVFSKSRPPYSVELDLGRAPKIHNLRAQALDADRRVLAEDEVLINTGPHRFAVRLIEPVRGRRYVQSVRAQAEVDVPELEDLDRVEFYLNETLVASLYQPPFIQPILIPPNQRLSYVRAVGVLKSGGAAEDVIFVNSPDLLDEVKVNFVELYTSVVDGKGRPVEGLEAEDFVILEDGEPQAIRRFELVRDLPIHAGILLDTSTSMTDRLPEAEEAAMHFFENVLTPNDRACLMTFNDDPELVVRFTNSVQVLAGGLAGLVAEGETALYDSLIYGLYYFSGLRGKRALILLSDGEDVSSKYTFDEVLEFARRTGVAIYSVGLAIPQRVESRMKLSRLCTETGGECFFIDRASELKGVYDRIQHDLRSQYLIAYQSGNFDETDRYREVELDVERPGLSVKTMRGYYP